jgi:hypothetical protein
MPLFSSVSVKMLKGCELTEQDWMDAVRKQDRTDAEIERRRGKYEWWESTDPIALQELDDTRLGVYLDGGKTWKQVQGECEEINDV